MTFYRHLLRHFIRRPPPPLPTTFTRTFAFLTHDEAKAAQRAEKRRRRIEPPLYALRGNPSSPRPPPDPNAPRLPDSTSSLVGHRLTLHNKVQSLIRGGDLDGASATARNSVFSRTRPTVFTCNAIIASMYRARRYDQSVLLFQYFFNKHNIVPNIVSYNYLILAYCESAQVDVALDVYRHILKNAPFSPSSVTYRNLTKGLIAANRINEAVDLVNEMLNKGHGADSLVFNNIIAGFLNLGDLERANEFFNQLKERCAVWDGVVNATFMDWYFKKGMEKEALECYQDLLDRDFKMAPATCNVLLEVLLKHGKSGDANAFFERMLDNHNTPVVQAVNSDTYNIMVNECFRLGKVSEAIAVFRQVGTAPKSKPFQMDGAGYNNMIEKLCQHGMVGEAEKLFQEMATKSVIMDYNTFRFFIEAYFKENCVDEVLQKFNAMLFEHNLKANPHFFNMVFDGLLKYGRIEEAGDILLRMGGREVKPDATTYELVIMVLCKERKLDRSRDLLSDMMRYNVLVTPTLRSSVNEAFGKAGRIDEIERLFGTSHQTWQGGRQLHPQEGGFVRGPPSTMHGVSPQIAATC